MTQIYKSGQIDYDKVMEIIDNRLEDLAQYMEAQKQNKDIWEEYINDDLPLFGEYGLCLETYSTDEIIENFDFLFKDHMPNKMILFCLCTGGPEFNWILTSDRRIIAQYKNWFCGTAFDVSYRPEAEWLWDLFNELCYFN